LELMARAAQRRRAMNYADFPRMSSQEKYIYHQIHPLKLLVDFGAGAASLVLFWRHELILALIAALVPPLVASFLVMRFFNLEPYKRSAFGRYVARHLSRSADAARFITMAIMAVGAWNHSLFIMIIGLVTIVYAWLRGFLSSAR
jgi:hypothetical protein